MGWTTVATFLEPWEAHLFRLRLEAEDISALVVHEHHIGANWSLGTALGGVKVQVLSGDEDRAIQMWTRCLAGEFREALRAQLGDLDDPRCPACGSGRVLRRASPVEMGLSVLMTLGTACVLPPLKSRRRCGDCGTRWAGERLTRV